MALLKQTALAHTNIFKFSPPVCLWQCSSANQKHLHSAVFQRQVKGTSPCPWEWAKRPQQSPRHYKSFRSCLGSTALHHLDRKMSRFVCKRTIGTVQSKPSLNLHCKPGLGMLSLRSYRNPRRNGDCPPEESTGAHSSKCGTFSSGTA